jgi:putative hydrolase of the HAD superfamily
LSHLRAVFLDLDDTLCDSRPAWTAGVDAAFDLLGAHRPDVDRQLALDEWVRLNARLHRRLEAGELTMRQVRERRFQVLLKRLDAEDDDLALELNEALAHVRLSNMHLFEDALPSLQALRGSYHVGVITNGAGDDHDDSQWSVLRQLGLLDLVDSVWISDEVGFRKPDPRIFEGVLEEVGLDPSEAAHVGDSPAKDVAGANAAGMTSVLLWRQAGEVLVEGPQQRPTIVVHTLAQLPEVLNR